MVWLLEVQTDISYTNMGVGGCILRSTDVYIHTTELYSDVHLVGMYKHVQILVCTNMHSTTECKSMKDLYRSVQTLYISVWGVTSL